jgi:hypothetical protein
MNGQQLVVHTYNGVSFISKSNEVCMMHNKIWMNLENNILKERSHTGKVTNYMIHFR